MPELKLNSKSSLSEIRKYERQLKKGYWLNRYHASWCSHCINMSEEWNNFTSHNINKDVRIASIEEQALSKLSEQPENFRGFPTITLTKNEGGTVSTFTKSDIDTVVWNLASGRANNVDLWSDLEPQLTGFGFSNETSMFVFSNSKVQQFGNEVEFTLADTSSTPGELPILGLGALLAYYKKFKKKSYKL